MLHKTIHMFILKNVAGSNRRIFIQMLIKNTPFFLLKWYLSRNKAVVENLEEIWSSNLSDMAKKMESETAEPKTDKIKKKHSLVLK